MGEVVVTVDEARSRLSSLVERAAAGEEIVIVTAGSAKVRLVPLAARTEPRQPGGWEGRVWIADDFDEPLPPDILQRFIGQG